MELGNKKWLVLFAVGAILPAASVLNGVANRYLASLRKTIRNTETVVRLPVIRLETGQSQQHAASESVRLHETSEDKMKLGNILQRKGNFQATMGESSSQRNMQSTEEQTVKLSKVLGQSLSLRIGNGKTNLDRTLEDPANFPAASDQRGRVHHNSMPTVDLHSTNMNKPSSVSCPPDIENDEKVLQRKRKITDGCQQVRYSNAVDWTSWKMKRQFLRQNINAMIHVAPREYWWNDFYISAVNHLVYCGISKAGNSNVRDYLYKMALGGREPPGGIMFYTNNIRNPNLARLDLYDNATKVKEQWANFRKFAFVREPLHRLISAWRDKFKNWNHERYYKFRAAEIIRSLRNLSQSVAVDTIVAGKPLSLNEFLEFLLYHENDSSAMDHHWRPQVLMCHFCEVEYDFIGLVGDDMSCEMEYWARHFARVGKVPAMQAAYKPYDIEAELASVPGELVRQVLKKHYAIDYAVLGFDIPV